MEASRRHTNPTSLSGRTFSRNRKLLLIDLDLGKYSLLSLELSSTRLTLSFNAHKLSSYSRHLLPAIPQNLRMRSGVVAPDCIWMKWSLWPSHGPGHLARKSNQRGCKCHYSTNNSVHASRWSWFSKLNAFSMETDKKVPQLEHILTKSMMTVNELGKFSIQHITLPNCVYS